ncbi:sensor histidine kinase [Spirillospora sp. CA-255316]
MLLSLTALWAFAAWVTAREGINLLWVNTLNTVVEAAEPAMVDLQLERRLTVVYLAEPTQQRREALRAQRAKTDRNVAVVLSRVSDGSVKRAADDVLEGRMNELSRLLRQLGDHRRSVDAGGVERKRAFDTYASINESFYRVYDAMATLDDDDFADVVRHAVAVSRSWELLSREDALVAGMLTVGRLSAADLASANEAIAIRRYAFDQAMVGLRDTENRQYREMTSSPQLAAVRALEDQLLQTRPGARPRITVDLWKRTTEAGMADMLQSIREAGERTVDRATPLGIWVVVRLVLAGGLGLLAVVASIIVSITTAQALVRQLERLRIAAWELAEQRLPSVVERLGHGEKVDVSAEAPPLEFGTDEIGQVSRAFNAVQETALRTAVEQAELRRGIRDVLLSLARRTQTLVHRQLSLLDQLERQPDIDPKDLQELFRLDHLATRMRRNAENLIVLSGAIPARGWRRSVPMVDVVRAAIGEVEDYTRVQVLQFGPVELAGRSVGDITHLLAELIENAVSFSPPDTVVQVGGHRVANGFAIDIEDRGLGMTDDKLAEVNARIADPPEFNLQSSVQLGLFVVGTLAERYGLQVMLKRSAYGGTTAVVVIPNDLVSEEGWDDQPKPVAPGTTTENGLEVRQPVPVGAGIGAGAGAPAEASSGRTGGAGGRQGQQAAPALVAVPDPSPTVTSPTGSVPKPGPAGTGGPGLGGEAAERPEQPATTPLEDPPPVPESSTTPSGLPVRVPQAHLVTPLKTEEPMVEPDEPEDVGRSPEEIQRIMGSYQLGSRRGRADAAKSKLSDAAVEGEDDQ